MRKYVYIVTFILLLSALMVNAQPANIVLKSPGNDAVITTYTQDFIFSFDQYPDMINCSLIVDDEVIEVRNALIMRTNNKMSIELKAGTYTWFIQCYDSDFNKIVSDTRKMTINLGGTIKGGYETIYNLNGLRSYVLTIAPGQDPVELPAMKAGEDIQIEIGAKTHYLDILKMGSDMDTNFVEVRDRTSNKIHRILVPSTFRFDFDEDKTIDIELSLNDVERNINAYFVVTPYPDTVAEEEVEEEPEEEPEIIEEAPIEEEPEEIIEEEIVEEEVEEEPEEVIVSEPEKKSKTWLILLIILIVLVIVLVIIMVSKSKKRVRVVKVSEEKKKEEKKEEPKEKKEEKKEEKEEKKVEKKKGKKQVKKKPEKKKEKVKKEKEQEGKREVEETGEPDLIIGSEKEEKPSLSESLEEDEDWPVLKEKFDIIKSTGRKRKK